MKIEHLYYFVVIVRSKSINKAAHRLYISQQHLSRIVNGLEKDLNALLFKRSSTGIQLTNQGKMLYDYAEKIISIYNDMKNDFYLDALPEINHEDRIQGSCELAFPFFFSLYLNDFIKKINHEYPEVLLYCFEDYGMKSAEELESSDRIHILTDSEDKIKSLFDNNQRLVKYYIGQTELSFCVNRELPLAEKRVLDQDDIAMHLITNYPQVHPDTGLLKNSKILFTSSNIYQHLDSVINNNSICFIPNYLRKGVVESYPGIVFIPYEHTFSVPIYIVFSEHRQLTVADKAVLRFVARYIQALNVDTNDSIQ